MLIEAITGSTTKQLKVNTPIAAILPWIKSNEATWGSETISVYLRRNKQDDITIIPENTTIKELIEGTLNDENIAIAGLGNSYGLIHISGDLDIATEIETGDNAHLEINLASLTSGTDYNVYGVEAKSTGRIYQKASLKRMITTQEKFSVVGLAFGSFPLTDLTSIKFVHNDGTSYTRLKQEILMLNALEGEVKQVRNQRHSLTGNAETLDIDIADMFEEQSYFQIDFDDLREIEIISASSSYAWKGFHIVSF